MDNSFVGIDNKATFALTTGMTKADIGKVVRVSGSANGTVSLPADGNRIFGILSTVDRDNLYGMVEQKGYQEVAYSGSIALGYQMLAADGSGGVKVVASDGDVFLVVDINSDDGIATVFFG